MFAHKLMIGSLGLLFAVGIQGQQGRRFVLLPERAAATIPGREIGEVFSKSGWKPTSAELDVLEANLSQISSLKAKNWNSNIHIDHPEKYFRQYVALVQAGRKEIYVNAFCDDPPHYWKDRLYVVADGGTCYWQAIYNPATKKFSDLTINGRA